MDARYQVWIQGFAEGCLRKVHLVGGERLPHEEHLVWAVRGRCADATAAMVAAFPELRRVRGHYGGREHWWCETAAGEVVDPTAAQFTPGAAYVEHTGPEPFGKCMNCGEYVWTRDFSGMCSDYCLQAITKEYR